MNIKSLSHKINAFALTMYIYFYHAPTSHSQNRVPQPLGHQNLSRWTIVQNHQYRKAIRQAKMKGVHVESECVEPTPISVHHQCLWSSFDKQLQFTREEYNPHFLCVSLRQCHWSTLWLTRKRSDGYQSAWLYMFRNLYWPCRLVFGCKCGGDNDQHHLFAPTVSIYLWSCMAIV